MAYREKTAWLTLICMAVAYGIYFPMMALRETPPTLFDILWSFGIIAGTQAVVVIIGHIVLAAQAPGAAGRPPGRTRQGDRPARRVRGLLCADGRHDPGRRGHAVQ